MGKDKLYWSIIEDMQWFKHSQEHQGYSTMKRVFMHTYSKDMAAKVRDFVYEKQGGLMGHLEKLSDMNEVTGFFGGDDSYNDMTAHVVGLGEEYYNAVLENPKLLRKLDYVESFLYSLPYDDDYSKLSPDHHADFAARMLKELADDVVDDKCRWNEDEIAVAGKIMSKLCLVIANDYEGAVMDVEFDIDKNYTAMCHISTGAANCLLDYKRYGGLK